MSCLPDSESGVVPPKEKYMAVDLAGLGVPELKVAALCLYSKKKTARLAVGVFFPLPRWAELLQGGGDWASLALPAERLDGH